MATFAKATFNAAFYSSFRPTYPPRLFKEIFEYHRHGSCYGCSNAKGFETARWDVAVDLGCGTGQATAQLGGGGLFRRVIGIDPSSNMLQAAREKIENDSAHGGRVTEYSFAQGNAERLDMLEDSSVDLVIAAQACHWFDWTKVWPETARILRRGGSAAYWVYAEFQLSDFPSTGPMITSYSQGKDLITSIGTYFERPGRTILENMLTEVPDPNEISDVGLGCFQRRYFSGSHFPPHLPVPQPSQVFPVEMRQTMRWRDLLGYFRTASALHNYHQKFPEDLERIDPRFPEDLTKVPDSNLYSGENHGTVPGDVDVSGGDIAVRFWKDLREEVKKQGGKYGVDEPVVVQWPIALLLAKKL